MEKTMSHQARVLLIDDGDVSGLLSAAVAADRAPRAGQDPSVVWAPSLADSTAGRRKRAAASHASFYALPITEESGPGDPGDSEQHTVTRLLVAAALDAAAQGIETVLWPAYAPSNAAGDPDLDFVAETIDRCLLVTRLCAVGAPKDRRLEVRAPYADFTRAQLADLVLDMDLPVHLCWWWEEGSDTGASPAAAERVEWLKALRAAGWSDRSAAHPRGVVVAGPAVGSSAQQSGPRRKS